MKLYQQEHPEIIRRMQNEDPFFAYLTKKIFSLLAPRSAGRMLDIGCGSGRNVFFFAKKGYRCRGIDIEPKVISIANKQANDEGLTDRVLFEHKDIMLVKPGVLGLYDVVILSEVIEHIDDYKKAIAISFSHVKKGGILIITTPHDPAQWNQLDDYAEHIRRFTKKDLYPVLSALGESHIDVVGFPFHRSVIAGYHYVCHFRNRSHQARSFRQSRVMARSYFLVGSLLLWIDDFFNFLGCGTTLIATVKK